MRSTWQLPPDASLPLRSWTPREVLLEFNGPELMTLDCDDALYLSVASDSDDGKVRWLCARISEIELNALLLGATTVRDCILKDEILVVDTDNSGRSQAEFVVAENALSEDDLPSFRSFLPDEIVAATKQSVVKPMFLLNGPSIVEHSIGFRILADLSQQIQRLWNAIGQTILGTATAKGSVSSHVPNETELRLAALQPGSVGLQVDVSNETLFSEIATVYHDLLQVTGDAVKLQTMLHTLKARARSAFLDYLKVLQRHDVEVLARWSDKAAFVSPFRATRIASGLEHIGTEEEERFSATGYFIGFHIPDATFEFQDSSDEETRYEGQVSPRVLSNPELKIVVGKSSGYEVEFTLFSWSAGDAPSKQHITLESVKLAAEADHSN